MTITKNGFEYTIPKKYKEMLTPELLKAFKDELNNILKLGTKHLTCEIFYDLVGTGAFSDAFEKACEITNSEELLKYHKSLDWWEGDLFEDEIVELLLTNKLIDKATKKKG